MNILLPKKRCYVNDKDSFSFTLDYNEITCFVNAFLSFVVLKILGTNIKSALLLSQSIFP